MVRHSDAQSGGPGAIMVRDDIKPLQPDHFLHDMFVHTRGLAEKDLSLALGLGETNGVDLPLAEIALQNLAAGLGVPHSTRRSDHGRTAPQGPREDERGLRLGHAGHARRFFALTVDHLFGTIWTRDGLSMRDRRMMLLTVLTALNQEALLEVQLNAVLSNGELTVEELKEISIFITHYVGFPLGSKLDGAVHRSRQKRKKERRRGAARDKKDNVNDAVHMYARKDLMTSRYAALSREELATLVPELLLIGQLIDRSGMATASALGAAKRCCRSRSRSGRRPARCTRSGCRRR